MMHDGWKAPLTSVLIHSFSRRSRWLLNWLWITHLMQVRVAAYYRQLWPSSGVSEIGRRAQPELG
jgi:hypothetical protein